MKSLECAICCHRERPLVERMLSKGEPVAYLQERFKGLNETVIREHRDLHMAPARSVEFASPQNILWDLQETRNQLKGVIDFALDAKNMKPAIALQAINSLTPVLKLLGEKAQEVHRMQSALDAEILKNTILEVLEDDPERMKKFKIALQRKMVEIEQQ